MNKFFSFINKQCDRALFFVVVVCVVVELLIILDNRSKIINLNQYIEQKRALRDQEIGSMKKDIEELKQQVESKE